MSVFESDFQFETYEEYYGDSVEVQQIIDSCQVCGAKVIFSHLTDYTNLFVQESGSCPECGVQKRKTIHILN